MRRILGHFYQPEQGTRDGSATLLHATADESSLVAGKRHRRLASRSLEKSSCCQVRGFGNTSSRFLILCLSSRWANTDHVLQMSRKKGNLADVDPQAV